MPSEYHVCARTRRRKKKRRLLIERLINAELVRIKLNFLRNIIIPHANSLKVRVCVKSPVCEG